MAAADALGKCQARRSTLQRARGYDKRTGDPRSAGLAVHALRFSTAPIWATSLKLLTGRDPRNASRASSCAARPRPSQTAGCAILAEQIPVDGLRLDGACCARAGQRGAELPLIVSDHADWSELCQTLSDAGDPKVWVTNGRVEALVHMARSLGIDWPNPCTSTGREDSDATSIPRISVAEWIMATGKPAFAGLRAIRRH